MTLAGVYKKNNDIILSKDSSSILSNLEREMIVFLLV